MLLSSVVAVLCSLLSVASALPAAQGNNETDFYRTFGLEEAAPLQSRSIPSYYWYYGADGTTHQNNFNSYSSQGYSMTSLSVYGSPPNVMYAAVWVKRSVPAWRAIHGVNAAAYQTWFDTNNKDGYVSKLVSVTGPLGGEIYAGVMDKSNVGSWSQQCALTPAQFEAATKSASNNVQILKQFKQYGTANDPRFCAIYYDNNERTKWRYWYGQDSAGYDNIDIGERSKRFWKPTTLTRSEDGKIGMVYSDKDTGNTKSGAQMTKAELDDFNTWAEKNGMFIISVQGSGTGSNIRYAAIWAETEEQAARSWSFTGSVGGFQNTAGVANELDNTLQTFMTKHGVRQGQLSIAKAGKTLIERGYTWAESSRGKTQPDSNMLLASVSKLFCAAAIQSLIDAGKLTMDTKAYAYIGVTSGFKDTRSADITINQLITHYGGWDNTVSKYDVVFDMRAVGQSLSPARPPTPIDLVNWMATKKSLDFTPGDRYAYSNYGYVLLSVIVEKASGMKYFDYLNSVVMPSGQKLGAFTSRGSDHTNDVIDQESSQTGLSADPTLIYPIGNAYAGDGLWREADLGGASIATSTSVIAKFVGTHAYWGMGGRVTYGGPRYGSMDGASSCVYSRKDGLDYAITINTRDFFPAQPKAFTDICEGVINGILDRYPAASTASA